METIALAGGGRETTRLGFGCSSVMGALGRKDSLAMLEAAFQAGIRHFDVAPSYGYGEAEACLGEFLARHPGQATVTTKFGIPPEPRSLKSLVRGLARPILKAMPGLKDRLAAASSPPTAAESSAQPSLPSPEFTPDKARASLERSLRALRVERIDLWLLHEATADDLNDDRLLRLLEDLVFAGKIAAFGVGSEARKIPALLQRRPGYCGTVQYEWSVLDPLIPPSDAFRIHHRALTENFRSLHEALAADSARRQRWSEHVGADVGNPDMLGRLMLKAALACNPASVILFSSKRPAHIQENAAVADDRSLEEQALRLYALVRTEVAVRHGAEAQG